MIVASVCQDEGCLSSGVVKADKYGTLVVETDEAGFCVVKVDESGFWVLVVVS